MGLPRGSSLKLKLNHCSREIPCRAYLVMYIAVWSTIRNGKTTMKFMIYVTPRRVQWSEPKRYNISMAIPAITRNVKINLESITINLELAERALARDLLSTTIACGVNQNTRKIENHITRIASLTKNDRIPKSSAWSHTMMSVSKEVKINKVIYE